MLQTPAMNIYNNKKYNNKNSNSNSNLNSNSKSNSNSGGINVVGIILIVVVVLIVISAIYWAYSIYSAKRLDTVLVVEALPDVKDAASKFAIGSGSIPNSKYSNEYSISMWLNIHDYTYNYGKEKMILRRGNADNNNLEILLDKNENDLIVRIKLQHPIQPNIQNITASISNFANTSNSNLDISADVPAESQVIHNSYFNLISGNDILPKLQIKQYSNIPDLSTKEHFTPNDDIVNTSVALILKFCNSNTTELDLTNDNVKQLQTVCENIPPADAPNIQTLIKDINNKLKSTTCKITLDNSIPTTTQPATSSLFNTLLNIIQTAISKPKPTLDTQPTATCANNNNSNSNSNPNTGTCI